MMKKICYTLIFLCFAAVAFGQNKYAKTITTSGNEMANSLLEKNYTTLVKYTYPKIIELMGGKKSLIATVSEGISAMEESGVRFSEVSIGPPEKIYTAGKELHCLVPQIVVLINSEGKIKASSYLLAISTDKGKNWYFLDTAQLNEQNAKEIFPSFNDELKIPAKTNPEFIAN